MSITWNNELTETLIDLYHTQNVLWDKCNANFKNKNKRLEAWKRISAIMGLHELEIQRKIKNLTAQFFREKNKMEAAGSNKPKWFAYKRLLFLIGKKRKPRLRIKNETTYETQYDSDQELSNEKDTQYLHISSDDANTNDITIQSSPDSEPLDPLEGCSAISGIRKNINGSKRQSSNNEQRFLPYNVLKEQKAKKLRNRFTIFGEHVAAKIEALKSSYAQNVVEHLISKILFEASIGKYDHPAPKHNASPEYTSPPSPQIEFLITTNSEQITHKPQYQKQ